MGNENKSIISQEKRDEITSNWFGLINSLKQHREEHKKIAVSRKSDLANPAWVRVSSAPPVADNNTCYRLCIGFQNVGCKYREDDPLGLGCLICGYYASTAFKDVNSHVIIDQFKTGLRQGCEVTTGFNSIEFLNDGSFLNTDEFDQDTQSELFDLVSRMPHIKRVLVESRPEYVNANGIEFLLDHLRNDQLLEIGIGLESVDNFVRELCINKGFKTEDFEKSLDNISSLNNKFPQRVTIVVYLIVKPAFLTHKECINDIVASLKYLYSLNKNYKFPIVPKLEPAAIADGTVLSMLYKTEDSRFYYEPLNYWAILEIIARVACETDEDRFTIRIGAREDMDDVLKAPAIYNQDGETFHPFDFVVYESIQKFNQHQSYSRLFAVIGKVYQIFNKKLLTDKKSSLMHWLKENGIKNSAIEKFVTNNEKSIATYAQKEEAKHEIETMVTVYGVLDILEGYCPDTQKLKKSLNKALVRDEKLEVGLIISECFEQVSPETIVRVSVINMSIVEGYAEIFFDVTNLLKNEKSSVWSRFAVDI